MREAAQNEKLTAAQDRAFCEWRDLAQIAAETKTVDAAIASGKAFARFHYLFIENTLRPSDKIIPLHRPSGFGGAA
ncbi:hypothetical protein NKI80_07315 [Mesorhizobium sp. M0387]|uniref:hypothetical protein n=1 Tax=Mesorhizobium sp. M0387 TaxID=2956940 RepID=UPI003336FE9C